MESSDQAKAYNLRSGTRPTQKAGENEDDFELPTGNRIIGQEAHPNDNSTHDDSTISTNELGIDDYSLEPLPRAELTDWRPLEGKNRGHNLGLQLESNPTPPKSNEQEVPTYISQIMTFLTEINQSNKELKAHMNQSIKEIRGQT